MLGSTRHFSIENPHKFHSGLGLMLFKPDATIFQLYRGRLVLLMDRTQVP